MITKTYSTASNARRALNKIGKAALCKAAQLIKKVDGQFQFDLEEAERIVDNYECDNSCECKEIIKLPKREVQTAQETLSTPEKAQGSAHPNMNSSLKLDRRIVCIETNEEFTNAHQMWKAHMDWMTTGQQDHLTAQLYAAAKRGEQIVVKVNGRSFRLLNVAKN